MTTESARSPEEFKEHIRSVARGMLPRKQTKKVWTDENNATITETDNTRGVVVRPKIHIIDGRTQ